MSLAENKELVRRVFDEFTNQRKFDLADELFAADVVDHGARTERAGVEGIRESLRLFLAGFPDFQYTIYAIFGEDDLVHVRGVVEGTHLGKFAGIPATGRHAQMSAMEDFRIENGKIVERWAERDRTSLMAQLKGTPS